MKIQQDTYLMRERFPLGSFLLITPDVVHFGARIEYPQVQASKDDECPISIMIYESFSMLRYVDQGGHAHRGASWGL
jgi:hypothetical protein